MDKYLPSKKVIGILVIPIIVIFIINIFILNEGKDNNKNEKEKIDFQTIFSKQPSKVKDQDEDGLFDWEETLYGTDPTNPDTDGDGKKDGDEIKNGTDPNINGNQEDDTLSEEVKGTDQLDYRNDPELSKTDILAKDFLSVYTNLKDAGNLGTPVQESAIQAVIDRNVDEFFKPKYRSSELNSVADSPESLAKYSNDYKKLFAKYAGNREYELFLYARYLETKEQEYLTKLKSNLSDMKNLSAELKQMQVPNTVLFKHLNLLNAYETAIFVIEEMTKSTDDPVYQFTLANSFSKAEDNLIDAALELTLFLEKNNLQ